jgi:hypothetical protein
MIFRQRLEELGADIYGSFTNGVLKPQAGKLRLA